MIVTRLVIYVHACRRAIKKIFKFFSSIENSHRLSNYRIIEYFDNFQISPGNSIVQSYFAIAADSSSKRDAWKMFQCFHPCFTSYNFIDSKKLFGNLRESRISLKLCRVFSLALEKQRLHNFFRATTSFVRIDVYFPRNTHTHNNHVRRMIVVWVKTYVTSV